MMGEMERYSVLPGTFFSAKSIWGAVTQTKKRMSSLKSDLVVKRKSSMPNLDNVWVHKGVLYNGSQFRPASRGRRPTRSHDHGSEECYLCSVDTLAAHYGAEIARRTSSSCEREQDKLLEESENEFDVPIKFVLRERSSNIQSTKIKQLPASPMFTDFDVSPPPPIKARRRTVISPLYDPTYPSSDESIPSNTLRRKASRLLDQFPLPPNDTLCHIEPRKSERRKSKPISLQQKIGKMDNLSKYQGPTPPCRKSSLVFKPSRISREQAQNIRRPKSEPPRPLSHSLFVLEDVVGSQPIVAVHTHTDPIWTILLQASHSEPCIQTLVSGISKIHLYQSHSLPSTALFSSNNTTYHRALTTLAKRVSILSRKGDKNGLQISLMAAYLFTVFERMRGNESSAERWIKNGFLVLKAAVKSFGGDEEGNGLPWVMREVAMAFGRLSGPVRV